MTMMALVLAAAAAAAPVGSADMGWLTGHWQGELQGGVTEEIWSAPAGGSLMGTWRWIEDGKVKLFEHLAVVDKVDGVVLLIRHIDPSGRSLEEQDLPLRLVLQDDAGAEPGVQRAVFEGRGEKGPVRVTYSREGDVLTFTVKDGPHPKTFTFRLVDGAGAATPHS